jgi:K+-transporting ATPase ATPase B chain
MFSFSVFIPALFESIKKFNPFFLIKNPVIFVTEIGAILCLFELFTVTGEWHKLVLSISICLWITVFFANLADSIAEAKNRAQAKALRKARVNLTANKLQADGVLSIVSANSLNQGDIIIVKQGETIAADGEIIEGSAAIDESFLTGESEPVIRTAGSDHNTVSSGTKIVSSDEIKIRIIAKAGESYLDKMIGLIEGAKRQKTHNEVALTILLSGLTVIFLVVIASLKIFGYYFDIYFPITVLIAFLICLIPTTIASLLSSVGMAGINRLLKKNVIALSGQAVEVAGDIDIIMMDKTGTLTMGNRVAIEIIAEEKVLQQDLWKIAYMSALGDETVEGKSILTLTLQLNPKLAEMKIENPKIIPFTASSRLSGVDIDELSIRKGNIEAIENLTKASMSHFLKCETKRIAEGGGTPLLISSGSQIIGAIFLKDIIKKGFEEKFKKIKAIGVKTVMITGDNPITAKTIAKEVGVDDYLAEATPEDKMNHLIELQKRGFMVAMTGDGINDAPALAHADVGVAMNAGTQAAKEAGNMIDLDSDPSKLFEIIEIGKQMLMTRGALTTFSTANDLSKYFAIIPAILTPYFPFFKAFNIMHLFSPSSAILSAVIFNAIIIIILIPLAFKGVKFVVRSSSQLLLRNILIYGAGGVIFPFIGIKIIDIILTWIGFV